MVFFWLFSAAVLSYPLFMLYRETLPKAVRQRLQWEIDFRIRNAGRNEALKLEAEEKLARIPAPDPIRRWKEYVPYFLTRMFDA